MKTPILYCTIAVLMISLSCNKSAENAVSENQNANIAFQLKTVNEAPVTGRIAGSLITWDSGYGHVFRIIFDGEGDCDEHLKEDHRHEWEEHHDYDDSLLHHHKLFQDSLSNRIVDLFTPASFIDTLPVSPCKYKNTVFKVLLRSDSTMAALELKGKNDSTTVIFRVNQPLEVRGTIDTAAVAAGNRYQAIILLNLAKITRYLSQADLNAATKDSSGAIVISASSNRELYDRMFSHFHEMEEHAFRH